MLKDAFENVAPYLSNIEKMREFIKKNEKRNLKEVIMEIENMIKKENEPFKTDLKILLNELRKRINMEM